MLIEFSVYSFQRWFNDRCQGNKEVYCTSVWLSRARKVVLISRNWPWHLLEILRVTNRCSKISPLCLSLMKWFDRKGTKNDKQWVQAQRMKTQKLTKLKTQKHSPKNIKRQKNKNNSKAHPKRTVRLEKHANENSPKRANNIKGTFLTPK